MSSSSDLSSELASFSGRAPLFPLPDVAFFPHVLLPLHIFEPRYRQMTADALEGERYIAIACLKLGWEKRPAAGEPIYDYVCLGRIAAEEKLSDGRYYLILQGVARARVVSEEASDLPYRVARLELRPDRFPPVPAIDRENRRREIVEAFRDIYPRAELDHLLHEATDTPVSLGAVCDIVASALRLPAEQTQEILAAEDVEARSDLVLNRLRELRRKAQGPPTPKRFPPGFSQN